MKNKTLDKSYCDDILLAWTVDISHNINQSEYIPRREACNLPPLLSKQGTPGIPFYLKTLEPRWLDASRTSKPDSNGRPSRRKIEASFFRLFRSWGLRLNKLLAHLESILPERMHGSDKPGYNHSASTWIHAEDCSHPRSLVKRTARTKNKQLSHNIDPWKKSLTLLCQNKDFRSFKGGVVYDEV